MSNVKGKGQRLIPEELLKYLEALKKSYPDPTQVGGGTLYLHSIKIPTYNNGYAIMSIVLPFDTPITKENFQDVLLPYIKVQTGPTTQYTATGEGYWQVQGSPKTFWVTSVIFANKNFGTNISLRGLGLNASNVVSEASYTVTDELTDTVVPETTE